MAHTVTIDRQTLARLLAATRHAASERLADASTFSRERERDLQAAAEEDYTSWSNAADEAQSLLE